MNAAALTQDDRSPADEHGIPSLLARARDIGSALSILMRDHGRLDQVLVFAQAVNAGAVRRAVEKYSSTPDGEAMFRDKLRIDRDHVDFDALRRMPDGTLGREYTRFLDDNGIGPEAFEELPSGFGQRAAWIMLRMRQTHDLWHVLTSYTPDVRGEILLQAFTFAQVRVPSAFLLALLGTIRWSKLRVDHLRDLRRAYERGKATHFLATFRWEDHWMTPVTDLRALLACPD